MAIASLNRIDGDASAQRTPVLRYPIDSELTAKPVEADARTNPTPAAPVKRYAA
ncbi:MAG: hypothetical protein U0805_04880 [Pirellulales bacterium]